MAKSNEPLIINEISIGDKIVDLWGMMWRTSHAVVKARAKELLPYNISGVIAGVLAMIEITNGNITPSEISRQLYRDAHSVSELLDRMQRAGLINKFHDLPRKNQVRVALTPKGREVLAHSSKRDSIHDIFSALTPTERRQLSTMLKKLRAEVLKLLK
jgi:DNA-binding MarR family transcriptional regulator